MPVDLETLPDDVQALRVIIAQQALDHQKEITERDEEIETLVAGQRSDRAMVRAMEALVEELRQRIAKLKHQQYGRSSEKIERQIAQLELTLEDYTVSMQSTAPPLPSIAPLNGAPDKHRCRGIKLPDDIDHRRITIDPGHECPDCGGPLRVIGEDVSQLIELVAAKIEMIDTVRPKKSCRQCEKIVQAPLPAKPIARSLAGPGLLAHILVSKYDDHLPLYRQGEIFARIGLEIPRSTLIDWTGQSIRMLRPLVDALRSYVLSKSRLHTDDTTVRVLDPTQKRKKAPLARLWVYVHDDRAHGGGDPPAIAYYYSPNRQGIHPQTHLKDFKGILQADAYAGYQKIYEPDPITGKVRVREAACMAHLRRDFHDVFVADKSPIAKEALDRIGELYDIERTINGYAPDIRLAVRQKESVPRVAAMKVWFEKQLTILPGSGKLAKAFRYGLNRWAAFCLFLEDGTVAIDNNPAERAIRPLTLGRRNWLFAGSHGGGENAAAIMSLIESAKVVDINPELYLADIFARINDHKVNRIDELLPWRWKPLTAHNHNI